MLRLSDLINLDCYFAPLYQLTNLKKTSVQTSENFLYTLSVAVARSYSDTSAFVPVFVGVTIIASSKVFPSPDRPNDCKAA